MNLNNLKNTSFEERVVSVRKVTKVTTGGSSFSFSVVVVIGNRNGVIGFGLGKSSEKQKAILKAANNAKKNLIEVKIIKNIIPHDIVGKYGSSKVYIQNRIKGHGIVAGGVMRDILTVLGVSDVSSKIQGSSNPINVVRAAFSAFKDLRDPLQISRDRGVCLEKIFKG
jgi:small subunit ribosomal protein S5